VKVFDPDRLGVETSLYHFRRGVDTMVHLTRAGGRPRTVMAIDEVEPTRLAFSMEFIEGGDLTNLGHRGWDLAKKLQVFEAVCGAVAFAHQQGVVHRDVRPANVLIDSDGNPILTDFDISDPLFMHTMSAREP